MWMKKQRYYLLVRVGVSNNAEEYAGYLGVATLHDGASYGGPVLLWKWN